MLYSFLNRVKSKVSMHIMDKHVCKIIPSTKGTVEGGKHVIVYCIPYFRNSTYTHLQPSIQSSFSLLAQEVECGPYA